MGTKVNVKLMGHKEKKKERSQSFILTSLSRVQPSIGSHTMPMVAAAMIRRSLAHKDETTGALTKLKQPKKGVFNEAPFLKFHTKTVTNTQKLMALNGEHCPYSELEYLEVVPHHKQGHYRTEKRGADIQVDLRKRDTSVRARVKPEKKAPKDDLIDRLFFPRGTKYHIRNGRFIKCLEHSMYGGVSETINELIQSDGPVVFKGLNSPQRGYWTSKYWHEFKKPVAIQFDCSHFDKHIRKALLRYEHKFYKAFYRGENLIEITKLLNIQLANNMDIFTDDGYRFAWKSDGGRASGDNNTALGNVLIMCACMYYYISKYVTAKVRFVDEGDDCYIICEETDAYQFDNISGVFETFGLTLRIEGKVHLLNKIKFCQTSPIYINGQWIMIRTLDSVLLKDTCCLSAKTLKQLRIWLGEVGMGGAILNAGVPVLSVLYEKYMQWGERGQLNRILLNDFVYSGLKQLTRGLELNKLVISDENRYQFYLTCGMLPEIQIAVETAIMNLSDTLIYLGPLVNWTSGLIPVLSNL